MGEAFKKYPFGYIFTEKKLLNYPSHYIEKNIDSNYYYYFDKKLNYQISKNQDSFC